MNIDNLEQASILQQTLEEESRTDQELTLLAESSFNFRANK